MELLLLRRDMRAKCEKLQVEETIALMWRQKENLDKTMVQVNSGSFGVAERGQGGSGAGSHKRRMSLQNGSSHG